MRPRTSMSLGQSHILGLATFAAHDRGGPLASVIFYGPPGTGQDDRWRIDRQPDGIVIWKILIPPRGREEVREILAQAKGGLATRAKRTVLFLDEISVQ